MSTRKQRTLMRGRLQRIRYAHGAKRETLVDAACVEIRAFFKAGRLPYSVALEILDRVADEIRDMASEMSPSWSEASWREDTRIHVDE